MMEGVVLFGTARRSAQLNGYSAAGKTGTAEKIDPRTHTYSKTKFVASFVGFAPVNNPAVTIAVIMDSPDHSMHFGAEASAPVFQELAQQILEYLGVPHDIDVKSAPEMHKALAGPGPVEHESENDEKRRGAFRRGEQSAGGRSAARSRRRRTLSTAIGCTAVALSHSPRRLIRRR